MLTRRPVNRLKSKIVVGSGRAQIVDSPQQLAHILWAADKGPTGKRNVVLLWMLFGSGLRINVSRVRDPEHIETLIHEILADYRIPGEWFNCSKDLAESALRKGVLR